MRQTLNENPVIQAAIVGVLAIGVAFLLLTRMSGGTDEVPPPPDEAGAPAPAGAVAPAPAPGAPDAPDAAPAPAPTPEVPPEVVGGLEAGPGLPAAVVGAYEDDKAVAVLVTRQAGLEDRALRRTLTAIEGAGNVEVFHVYARDIARFSRITGGVDVSRVPALVVVHPQSRSEGGVPVASVSYGFRGPASAQQAVRDALYDGRRNIPYHPYPE